MGLTNKLFKYAKKACSKMNEHIYGINNSKIFAGLMIIVLNISSKFVNIKLSKTMESYLKYTFSKQILVFAMAWMGTRDIYVALLITIAFIIITEFLFNEESQFCILPESFTNYHLDLLENDSNNNKQSHGQGINENDVAKIKEILEKNGVKIIMDSDKTQGSQGSPIITK